MRKHRLLNRKFDLTITLISHGIIVEIFLDREHFLML